MSSTAYLGLGSNLGDRQAYLQQALDRLGDGPTLAVIRVSSLYETEPQGPVRDQPAFYNAVAEVRTTLGPRALLAHCLAVEASIGRRRTADKGPRTIDVDVLWYDGRVERWPELLLPHPELCRRAFVLVPLLELAPSLNDPRDGRPLVDHLEGLVGEQSVVRSLTRVQVRVGRGAGRVTCG